VTSKTDSERVPPRLVYRWFEIRGAASVINQWKTKPVCKTSI